MSEVDDAVKHLRKLRCGYSLGAFFWEPSGDLQKTVAAVATLHPLHHVEVDNGLVWALPPNQEATTQGAQHAHH